jgi:predicted nucleic acid-binding protein
LSVVVDASAVVAALTERPGAEPLVDRLTQDGEVYAPHVLDLEFASAVRGLARGGELTESGAERVLDLYDDLAIQRFAHTGLLRRIWDLGSNLSVYDASYVALAEALRVPLVTADARLTRAPGHLAEIELL